MNRKQKSCGFKPGDHIFYFSPANGTEPHVVVDTAFRGVTRGWYVGLDDKRWVKESKCQLQSEWEKENA